ncbi:quinolinate synthase NadA [Anaerosacchariphilus polymeriproducens]|uniref:Quinolinate synthase n=1 Tax=Anaerosacchariphilus polymeriproducens TaxID=1812858 RepID=A0A371AWU3_9FIRM|nr:quinolinate synthase NadA [Anaerosacchariphilus polymeriproducens]RDU24037.1 quinolinate synthase NadA [Anaerosacchariphilus polymeriproducens]
MTSIIEKIEKLKKERDAVIVAHYYVNDEVQEIADYIGDSYYLSKIVTTIPQKTIVFAGVSFMGESAKILNPEKTILLPDETADCPMAHMVDTDRIDELRKEYEDLAVVCYINSTAKIKEYADVCVTSSNALKVVKALPNKHILFIPDEHLGRYIASLVPEKEFIFNEGFCHVHTSISRENLEKAIEMRPDAEVLVHPECKLEILELADYIGSTSGIIDYATESDRKEFIICTEMGVFFELNQKNPDKKFYSVGHRQFCPNMKKISLEKIAQCLETMSPTVELNEEQRTASYKPLIRMLELAK